MQDERKLEVGVTLETDKGTFVVTGVSYQEKEENGEQVRHNFTYSIKDPADLIEETE